MRCAHVVLHRAVAHAVRWGLLARNLAADATRPAVPRATIRPPAASDVRALIAHAAAHDPGMACWIYVATAAGARRGEICGLRWADIDFHQRSIRIERSVTATRDGVLRQDDEDRRRQAGVDHRTGCRGVAPPPRASDTGRSTDRHLR